MSFFELNLTLVQPVLLLCLSQFSGISPKAEAMVTPCDLANQERVSPHHHNLNLNLTHATQERGGI
jgi:hypothetical protein